MDIKICISIINYNSGDYLLKCVKSIFSNQIPCQIYILDNASVDSSLELVETEFGQLPNLTIERSDLNLGFGRAHNRVIKATKSEYVLLLNPDCELAPDTISRCIAFMDAQPRCGMLGAKIVNPDLTEQRGCRRQFPSPKNIFLEMTKLNRVLPSKQSSTHNLTMQPMPESPFAIDVISGSFMFVRRLAMDGVGLLDEGYFMHCEDVDWCRRFYDSGWSVILDPTVVVVHDKGICSRSVPYRILWYKHYGMWRYYNKFLRGQYNILVNAAVKAGIVARFILLTVKQPFSR